MGCVVPLVKYHSSFPLNSLPLQQLLFRTGALSWPCPIQPSRRPGSSLSVSLTAVELGTARLWLSVLGPFPEGELALVLHCHPEPLCHTLGPAAAVTSAPGANLRLYHFVLYPWTSAETCPWASVIRLSCSTSADWAK